MATDKDNKHSAKASDKNPKPTEHKESKPDVTEVTEVTEKAATAPVPKDELLEQKQDNDSSKNESGSAIVETKASTSSPVPDKKKKSETLSADEKTQKANEELERLEVELKAKQEEEKASETIKPSAPKKPVEPTQPNKPAQSAKTTSAKPTRKFSWWGFLAFWFSLIAVGGVAYLWWLAQIWQAELQADLNTQQQQSSALANRTFTKANETMAQVQKHISQLQMNQQNSNDFVMATQRDLDSLEKRIKELGQSQPNTWLAAEALYLVNLAEHRIVVEDDVDTAIQMLLSANLRLTAMNDPSVFYLRTAISEDVALLSAIKTPETEAIFLTLSGLITQVPNWTFAHKYIPEPSEMKAVEDISDDTNDWRENLSKSVGRLMENFISVERRDVKVEPELPPNERWYVRANITSQLIAAQHASLKYQTDVYNKSLSQIELWLQQYFDVNQPEIKAALESIAAIKAKSVALTLPNELSSQALLSNYVNSLQSLKSGKTQTASQTQQGEEQ